ncbi:MAG: hypothetical protein NT067_03550 [Candidatus Diapherotrites archaeon]|nr:hypothetical protein [Candidatus Diapherotrites archaeon]
MKLTALAVFLVLAFSTASAGYFNYSIELQGKDALFTVTIGLESQTEATSFALNNFFLPENSTVVSLRDSIGQIKNYSVSKEGISFETNSGGMRSKETVELKFRTAGIALDDYSPLYSAEISLPGSSDSRATIEMKGARIISFEATPEFSGEISGGSLKLSGKGPAAFAAFYSKEGAEFQHFVLFNKSGLPDKKIEENGMKEADGLFDIIPRLLGFNVPFEKIPVLVLGEEEYAERINSYSEGVYRTGGIIVLRESAFEKNAAAVVLHETVHAFNAQAMKWNESGASWFDEGMAKFIEAYARKMLGEKSPNLFYGDVTWKQGSYQYTLKPAGNLTDLEGYIAGKERFMEEWNTDNAETRDFGYAFAELYVRAFLKEKGFSALQQAYRKMLEIKETAGTGEEFSAKIVSLLGKELYPCGSESGQEIKKCVEGLNSFEFSLPETVSVLQLGLSASEKEFGAEGKTMELKKQALLEKIANARQGILELMGSVFLKLLENRQAILAGVKG